MSIAGCIRIRLSWLEVSANNRILEERGGGQRGNPVTCLVKCPRNSTYGKYEAGTLRSQGNWQNDRHVYVRNVAQENRKHRPELQSHKANWQRPTRSGIRRYRWSHCNSPRAPTEPKAWGDAPPHKRNAHQWRKLSAKTRCKRGDNVTGSINETDAKKRLRARSGHSQRASAKPTTEADMATTKKERGMEWVSDSDRASNWGTNARKVTDSWRGRTKQRGKIPRRLAAAGRITASAPAATGCQENRQTEAKASPEGEGCKPKNNLLTGGRAEQVDLEADLRPGEHNGENQEPPTTSSFSEDHPVRGHQRLQGASRATDRVTKP